MTTPNGQFPDDTFGSDLSGLSGLDEASWRAGLNSRVIGTGGGTVGFNGLSSSLLGAIFGTVDNSYVSQLPIIQDHTASITDIQATIDRMILQGQAIVFTTNGTYTKPDGLVSVDVILIGAGGSGGGPYTTTAGGYGGGGGGEVHTSIPAALLAATVPVVVGKARDAGTEGNPGYGGGNTSFGELVAGGGEGGYSTMTTGLVVRGGTGMIPGGDGGQAHVEGGSGYPDQAPTPGGSSQSPYSLNNGGGGGGGGGYGGVVGQPGGAGSVAAGGLRHQDGHNPPDVAAIGAGGGGGADSGGRAGDGGYPGGGGGGGGKQGGVIGSKYPGGQGGNGVVFVLERFA